MKTWKDFLSFTNIRERIASLLIMLMLLSILYCSIYSMGISVVSRAGSMLVSYLFLYLIVVVAAYVYLIVMFQFIRTKREDIRTLTMKDYMFPLIGVQTLLFVVMVGSSWLSFQLMLADMSSINTILTPIMLVLMMFYIPVQVFACFAIYDGARNPFLIIKDAFVKIIRHYRSSFYSMLVIFLIAFAYTSFMNAFFQYGTLFAVNSGVVDIMTRSNPFMDAMELGLSLFDNMQLLPFLYLLSMVLSCVWCWYSTIPLWCASTMRMYTFKLFTYDKAGDCNE